MKRIQFELSEDHIKELEELMQKTGVRTKKDLVNNALTLLEWAVQEVSDGRTIASVDERENKYKEVVMPFFRSLKKGESHTLTEVEN